MEKIKNEKEDVILVFTKKEFHERFIVGCLEEYDMAGGEDSIVRVKVYGLVPDLKHCVLNKT